MTQSTLIADKGKARILLPALLIVAILTGWATASMGFFIPAAIMAVILFTIITITIFKYPKLGLALFIFLSFTYPLFGREIGNFPYQNSTFAIIILTWIVAILKNDVNYKWSNLSNDLCIMGFAWFALNILQLANPGGTMMGWLADGKYPLLWVLIVPLTMAIFHSKKDLNFFLILIIGLSLFAALYGIKQNKFGLTQAEKEFVLSSPTHLIFHKLRVFSFYPDAGQFGASMAQFCIIALTLAFGPFKKWKRIVCGVAAALFLYNMFISGTRGALFALAVGAFIFLALTKNFKVMLLGAVFAFGAFFFLKYTYIGHGIYEIKRMRSALNPEDASLGLRLANQAKLADYLKDYPFGRGVGSIGYAADMYASESYLASIPPDSFWVKVWAMYGIVGMIIWFGMMMYIIGKGCGIIWNTHDRGLKYKLIALTAGSAGIFVCSYGNEVINLFPSSIVVYFSWAFVFLGPQIDKQIKLHNLSKNA